MPSLKDLRNRINSVKSTRKITSAMKMVSAAKLRRAQELAEAGRPYADRMNRMIAALASAATGGDAPRLLAGSGAEQTHLLVVMTADRGLCGGFNSSITRAARAAIRPLQADGKTREMRKMSRQYLLLTYVCDLAKSMPGRDARDAMPRSSRSRCRWRSPWSPRSTPSFRSSSWFS